MPLDEFDPASPAACPDDLLTAAHGEFLRAAAHRRLDRHANGWRQRMVVELALHTGAKVSELVSLRVEDVRLVARDETIRVTSEARPRVLPLTGPMVALLDEYLTWKSSVGEATDAASPLVCSQRGGPLTMRGWQDAWALAQRHAGLLNDDRAARFSLESAREHAGRRVYGLRHNPHDVQAWLGLAFHSNVERFRPSDLSFNPVDLRPLLPGGAAPARRRRAATVHPDLARAVGLYNGTGGRLDRHRARDFFLAVPTTDPLGQFWIARCLDRGRCFFPRDPALAQRKAAGVMDEVLALADAGGAMAMYLYACACDEGLGRAADHELAVVWYEKAIAAGNETSWNNLGLLHEYGKGTPRDSRRAVAHFREGAARHEGSSMFNLAVMLGEGISTPRDPAQALAWYHRAAALGEPRSMNNLSYLYANGLGVERNAEVAERWFLLAGQLNTSARGYVNPGREIEMIRLAG